MDFTGTVAHTPRRTEPWSQAHRRVNRMLSRLRFSLPQVPLRPHEARMLLDMAHWQAAANRRDEFDLSPESVLDYLDWLFSEHVRYVHTHKAMSLLATAQEAAMLANAAQFVCQQLILVDLEASHHLQWRIDSAVAVLDSLRSMPFDAWSVTEATDRIGYSFKLHDSLVRTVSDDPSFAEKQRKLVPQKGLDTDMPDAQPQPAVSLSSVESNASKSNAKEEHGPLTEPLNEVGDLNDKDHTLEDDSTSQTVLIDQEAHPLPTSASPTHAVRATSIPSKIEIAATQSSLANSSVEVPIQASSQQINSSPSDVPRTQSNSTRAGLFERMLTHLPKKQQRNDLVSFIQTMSRDDVPLQDALKHVDNFLSFLKDNEEVLKNFSDAKDIIISLNDKLAKATTVTPADQTQQQIIDERLASHSSDTKILLEYLDRRVNAIQSKAIALENKYNLIGLMEEGMAQLQQNMVDLKEYSTRRMDTRLSKHVEALEKFNGDLAKLANITLEGQKESKVYKKAISKKLDHALSLQNSLQREFDTTVAQLNLNPLKKRLEKVEEEVDDVKYRLSSNANATAAVKAATVSGTELDEMKRKLDDLSMENYLLRNRIGVSDAKEAETRIRLKQQQKLNEEMVKGIGEMKQFQETLLQRFTQLENKVQHSQGSTQSSGPLAQSTQREASKESPSKTKKKKKSHTKEKVQPVHEINLFSDDEGQSSPFLDVSVRTPDQLNKMLQELEDFDHIDPIEDGPDISPTLQTQTTDRGTGEHTTQIPSVTRPQPVPRTQPLGPVNRSASTQKLQAPLQKPATTATTQPSVPPACVPSSSSLATTQLAQSGSVATSTSKASTHRRAQNEAYKKTMDASSKIKELLSKTVNSDPKAQTKGPASGTISEKKRQNTDLSGFNVDLKKIKLMQRGSDHD